MCDVYDAAALARAVRASAPDLVLHELTDLPDDASALAAHRGDNARMRREGTRNLLDAAAAAGVRRLLAQSIAWETSGDGAVAKQELERAVLGFGGVVLRYGQLYGPGTYYEARAAAPPTGARRRGGPQDGPRTGPRPFDRRHRRTGRPAARAGARGPMSPGAGRGHST